jgi:hypothetical protein
MPWRCAARENLDDDHATATAWTSGLVGIDSGTGRLALRFCSGEQLAGTCDVVGKALQREPVQKLLKQQKRSL